MLLQSKDWPCGRCECDETGAGAARVKIPGLIDRTSAEYGQCWRKLVTPFSWQMLDFHRHYLRGNLALAGGVCDQPGVYLDAMALITEWMQRGSKNDG